MPLYLHAISQNKSHGHSEFQRPQVLPCAQKEEYHNPCIGSMVMQVQLKHTKYPFSFLVLFS